MILFFANSIFGLYFLNMGINFITLPVLPAFVINSANIVGGGLLILGGFLAMRSFSYRRIR